MSLAFRAFFALPTDLATVSRARDERRSRLRGDAVVTRAQGPVSARPRRRLRPARRHVPRRHASRSTRAAAPRRPGAPSHQFELIRDLRRGPVHPGARASRASRPTTFWRRSRRGARRIDPRRDRGDRRPRRLPAGRGPRTSRCSTTGAGVSDYRSTTRRASSSAAASRRRRYPLFAALRGDTSDNLPGVPGVGEKTAAKLFAQYRDMDDLFAHLGDLTPKLRENLGDVRRARAQQREGHDADPRRAARLHAARHHPRGLEPFRDRCLLRPFRDESDAHAVRSAHEGGPPG